VVKTSKKKKNAEIKLTALPSEPVKIGILQKLNQLLNLHSAELKQNQTKSTAK
jgi:hypothetical protein